MLLNPSVLKRQLNFCIHHLPQRETKGREEKTTLKTLPAGGLGTASRNTTELRQPRAEGLRQRRGI